MQGQELRPTKLDILFFGDITEKRRSAILVSFQYICPGLKHPEEELVILGSQSRPKIAGSPFGKKIIELDEIDGIAEKLDTL